MLLLIAQLMVRAVFLSARPRLTPPAGNLPPLHHRPVPRVFPAPAFITLPAITFALPALISGRRRSTGRTWRTGRRNRKRRGRRNGGSRGREPPGDDPRVHCVRRALRLGVGPGGGRVARRALGGGARQVRRFAGCMTGAEARRRREGGKTGRREDGKSEGRAGHTGRPNRKEHQLDLNIGAYTNCAMKMQSKCKA
ncbi:hypothetical protein B0H17DRAFT_40435 [Mycena rosella]|uniref:Uncharacterized protein n=1 Tax=Mycena rosella TaxID=1033263 RepID=A0AAD7M6V5_MYCRO|nr:hypothetical protein B0H17DRAFT_40435 [Mycena rosella]